MFTRGTLTGSIVIGILSSGWGCSGSSATDPSGGLSLCDRAAAHASECLGEPVPESVGQGCDEARAQQMLDTDCDQLGNSAGSVRTDGASDSLCWLGFTSYCPKDAGVADATVTGTPFTFALIADPHIDDQADSNRHLSGLNSAIQDIIKSKPQRNTKLVFVLGDVGWGTTEAKDGDKNLAAAKKALDALTAAGIQYVPMLGDDDVWGMCGADGTTRCEIQFNAVFEPQYAALAASLPGWKKAPLPVNGKYLQNFSFDYGDAHFIGADFVSRNSARSEAGDTHSGSEGSKLGTWAWVKQDIQEYLSSTSRRKTSINFISHIPMASRVQVQYPDPVIGHAWTLPFELGKGVDILGVKMAPLGFTDSQADTFASDLEDSAEYLGASYAGHLHLNAEPTSDFYSYPLPTYLVHPTWGPTQCDSKKTDVADNWTVRYVKVTTMGEVTYQHELVERQPGKNSMGVCIAKE